MNKNQRPFFHFNTAPMQERRRRVARTLVRLVFGPSRGVINAAPLPTVGIHRILIAHPSHTLGNTLLLTPLLGELQRIYPGAEIDILARSPVADDIFRGFDGVRHIHHLPRHGVAAPWRLLRVIREMRSCHYDLAIDPCIRSQSDRIGVLLAKATWKLGYIGPSKSGPLTHGVIGSGDVVHNGKMPVYLLHRALDLPAPVTYPPLSIRLRADEKARAAHGLASLLGDISEHPVIGLFGNATGTKFLGMDWWQRFGRRLEQRATDHRIVELVPIGGRSLFADRYPTLYSSDIRRLAAALSQLSLFISADCGVMHLACAAGVPTVGFFSATDPAEWGPYGEQDLAIELGGRTPEDLAYLVPLTAPLRRIDPGSSAAPAAVVDAVDPSKLGKSAPVRAKRCMDVPGAVMPQCAIDARTELRHA